jgi:hypothetical protein
MGLGGYGMGYGGYGMGGFGGFGMGGYGGYGGLGGFGGYGGLGGFGGYGMGGYGGYGYGLGNVPYGGFFWESRPNLPACTGHFNNYRSGQQAPNQPLEKESLHQSEEVSAIATPTPIAPSKPRSIYAQRAMNLQPSLFRV